MAVNFIPQDSMGFGSEPRSTAISFAPNGTSNPLAVNNQGPPGVKSFTTTYSATGVYTIVFHPDYVPPADTRFLVSPQCESLANYFEVIQVGAYNAATRTLVVQAKRTATGQAVAAAAGARIHIAMLFNESTGG